MGAENALRHAAGLKEGKAQKDRIAHAPPDGSGYVVGCGNALHKHRIDTDAYHNEKQGCFPVPPGCQAPGRHTP